RERLAAEGLFDVERKRALLGHPGAVAVVTSPQAAAWGDIQRTLAERYPGLQVLFSPAVVQGEQAPASIVTAIQRVERDRRAQVLLLARGGGATEELSCFNDERVVRAIAECSIPVVAGIGHQRDESLADLVADVCAHTPTAAAELVVPRLRDLSAENQHRIAALRFAMSHYLAQNQASLNRQQARLQKLQLERHLAQELAAITRLRQRLFQVTRTRVQQATQHHQLLAQKLAALDPQAVLKRGYSVVRQADSTIIRAPTELHLKQVLTIQLLDGYVKVQVTEIPASPPLLEK
ncbi:MAG TPA: exodeoxyribonuclease VII large subunit, partial [Candidatus Caenarcaniphilales bacterium]